MTQQQNKPISDSSCAMAVQLQTTLFQCMESYLELKQDKETSGPAYQVQASTPRDKHWCVAMTQKHQSTRKRINMCIKAAFHIFHCGITDDLAAI